MSSEYVVKAFDNDLRNLGLEQGAILELFREVELFVPAEEGRLTDDKYMAELAELKGLAQTTRIVSREMIMQAIGPSIEKLMVLNQARERLLSHSLAVLEGPGSVMKFLESVNRITDESVGIESALKKAESVASQGLVS